VRIRTIKPEFWASLDTAKLSEPAILLAIGILNYADDDGYFLAVPELIKASLFPLREPSRTIPGLLRELSGTNYIEIRKGADGRPYGQVLNFKKHQAISKPKPSKLKDLWPHPGSVQDESGTNPGLIPDESGICPVPVRPGTGNREQGKEQGSGDREQGGAGGSVSEIRDKWNALAEELKLAKVEKLTGKRATSINARCGDGMLSDLSLIFDEIRQSDFLRGVNSQGWQISFDWLFGSPSNWVKVREGNYRNKQRPPAFALSAPTADKDYSLDSAPILGGGK
jgi:hypothetical protein